MLTVIYRRVIFRYNGSSGGGDAMVGPVGRGGRRETAAGMGDRERGERRRKQGGWLRLAERLPMCVELAK